MREKLSATAVAKMSAPGRYADGGGLYLLVKPDGRKTWVYRWRDRVTGKLRDKGLGPYGKHDVSLAEARIAAGRCRQMVRDNLDPIAEDRKALQQARREYAQQLTFFECAERYIHAQRAGWKNKKHAAQWPSSLKTHAPSLLDQPVAAIDTSMVVGCLEPIWASKTETATRVRQRIEAVLDWATVRGHREGENPARWKGHLDKILPKPSSVRKVTHHPSLPYTDIANLVDELRKISTLSARCLEFQILTAARPGEAAGAKWSEIDIKARTWAVPADRMKGDKEHVVPLSTSAVKLLSKLPRACAFVFPSRNLDKGITTDANMKLLKKLRPEVVAHGFRSTFREWASDLTNFPREVIEHAIAHQLKDKTEAAYQRKSAFPKRVKLMDAWAEFLDTTESASSP